MCSSNWCSCTVMTRWQIIIIIALIFSKIIWFLNFTQTDRLTCLKHFCNCKSKVVPRGTDELQDYLKVSGFLQPKVTDLCRKLKYCTWSLLGHHKDQDFQWLCTVKTEHMICPWGIIREFPNSTQVFPSQNPAPIFPNTKVLSHWNSSLRWTCSSFQQIHLAAQFHIQLLQGEFQATCTESGGKKKPLPKATKPKKKQNKE